MLSYGVIWQSSLMGYLMKRRVGLSNILFTALILTSLTSCKDEEFYEKEFYETYEDTYRENHPDEIVEDNIADEISEEDITSGNSNTDEIVVDGGADSTTDENNDDDTSGGSNDGQSDPDVNVEELSESFTQDSEAGKVDILWVVDNSASMADEQAALAYNFDAFIRDFITKDVDFQMAITTTDFSVVNGSKTALTKTAMEANQATFLANFEDMIQVGIAGSYIEKGLAAAKSFAINNQNFLREDAYLAIVYVSDEEDQSSGTVSSIINEIQSQKADPSLIKTYSIVDTEGLTEESRYMVTGYQRYLEAKNITGGSVSNIYGDFYQTLSSIGESIANLTQSFALSGNPILGSIQVLVDGEEVSGWTYDSGNRTITFNQGSIPAAGATIVVNYSQEV